MKINKIFLLITSLILLTSFVNGELGWVNLVSDDFDDGSLNTSLWVDTAGQCVESGSILTCTDTASGYAYLEGLQWFEYNNTKIEINARFNTGTGTAGWFGMYNYTGGTHLADFYKSASIENTRVKDGTTLGSSIEVFDELNFQNYTIIFRNSFVEFWIDEVLVWNSTANNPARPLRFDMGYQFISAIDVQEIDSINIYGWSLLPVSNYFQVTSKSFWDNSLINNFSIDINGTIYNTTNGTIITNLYQNDTNLYNITFFSDDWFNTSYLNINVSSNLIGYMNQSIINFSVKGVYSNITISNYTFEIDGVNTSVGGSSVILNPNSDNYTVAIYDNEGIETFIVFNNPIIINALDNLSYIVYVSDHLISVNAVDYLGATINTFNATIINNNLSLTETKSTTTGNILFNASEYSYTVSIDAAGYAFTDDINLTVVNPNRTFYANFTLYPTNSVNFTFYYENTPLIIANGTNISFDLINGGASTYNTSVGWKWIEDLTSADYEIRYMSEGFDSRSYFFTVSDRSTQLLTFYLSNSSLTTNYIIRVADLSDKDVSNAVVRLQRQYVDFNGSFKTVEECLTNDDGECDLFIEESSEIVYRFIILVNDEIVKTTNPQNIVNIAGVTTKQITIQIDIGTSIFEAYESNSNLFSDLTFGSNISNYTFIDGNNELVSGCLKITRRGLHSSTGTVVSNVCENGSSGDISTDYTSYIVNNTVLVFEGTANYNTYSVTLEKAEINFISKGVNSNANDDLLLTVFIIIILVLASILVRNIYIQLSILFIGLYAVSWIGFNKLGVTTIIILGFVTIIMNYNNRNTSGGQQL